ncbi:hypothetical protein [Streptomyces noursei]|uniref:hypothetical protein n=1 Tax=Streptomyces noursei TaxID=1971 RepID=UPI001674B40C|nr:hypothetical protein [Streptomyces noursei]MCZ1019389.1 hypothetical protein [Streptomyces noursei]GGX08070.1 hypothetical protein GCM10010341_32130 [Streptomyces noursei]
MLDAQLKQILTEAGPEGVGWPFVLRQLGAPSADVERAATRIGAEMEFKRTGQAGRPAKVVKLGEPTQ